MNPGTTTQRAVMCANGKIHYGPEYLKNDDERRVRDAADQHGREPWCGGTPHYIGEQTITVSRWVNLALNPGGTEIPAAARNSTAGNLDGERQNG